MQQPESNSPDALKTGKAKGKTTGKIYMPDTEQAETLALVPVATPADGSADDGTIPPAHTQSAPLALPVQNAPVPYQDANMPLYLRNPGPPPKLPRNADLTGVGRSSYRFRGIGSNGDYRVLLIGCAAIGLIMLFILVVLRPQDNIKVQSVSVPAGAVAVATATFAPTSTPNVPNVVTNVDKTEQFALVVAKEGIVLEEARDGSAKMQTLQQYTILNLERKSSRGWYELKGGGWIKASSIKLYGDIEATWAAKRDLETVKR
jgi:hypothetical protein